jgi:hypothetical protein
MHVDLCMGSVGALPLPLEGGRGGAQGCSGASGCNPPGMAGELLLLLLIAWLRRPRGERENGGAVCTGVASG